MPPRLPVHPAYLITRPALLVDTAEPRSAETGQPEVGARSRKVMIVLW